MMRRALSSCSPTCLSSVRMSSTGSSRHSRPRHRRALSSRCIRADAGNPVLPLGGGFGDAIMRLEGDRGAGPLLRDRDDIVESTGPRIRRFSWMWIRLRASRGSNAITEDDEDVRKTEGYGRGDHKTAWCSLPGSEGACARLPIPCPKPLVRVAGRTMLDHALDRLAQAGITPCHRQHASPRRPDRGPSGRPATARPPSPSRTSAMRCWRLAAASAAPCRFWARRRFWRMNADTLVDRGGRSPIWAG